MKKQIIIIVSFIVILITVLSCNKKKNTNENKYGEEVKLNIQEMSIDIDSSYLNTYNIMSSMTNYNGNELIVGYNDKLHTLDLIDIEDNFISKIPLSLEGPNGILPSIKGLHAHNHDSIWIFNNNTFYLVNNRGNVTWKYSIPAKKIDGYIINDLNYAIANSRIYYNSKHNSLFFTSLENKEFYENELMLSTLTIQKYKLEKVEQLNSKPDLYGWKQLPNVCFNKNLIVYNYPIDSRIYTLNIETGAKEVYNSKSRNTSNTSNKIIGEVTFESMEKHKIENIHFFEVLYNEKYNCYFRMHLDAVEYNSKADISKLYQKKDIHLMVFDENFSIINESKLLVNKYLYFNGWVNSTNGLIILHRENTSPNLDNESLVFDIIHPSK